MIFTTRIDHRLDAKFSAYQGFVRYDIGTETAISAIAVAAKPAG
jgi:hypothetical protein